MNANFKKLALFVATAAALAATGDVRAEAATASDTVAPYNTALNAAVNLDFRIRIPSFLFFQVGSAAGTIDQIDFVQTAAGVPLNSPVAGSSTVAVTLRGNSGPISITPANNSAGLGLGTGTPADGYISYADIAGAVTAGDATLASPALTNAGGTPVNVPVSAGQVTNKTATWTFTYTPTSIPAAGDYGTQTNGGRVTYTASMP